MNIAFFCSTPYQIINAINLKLNELPENMADIYVLNHFRSCEWIVNRLKTLNIFRHVFQIDDADFDYQYDLPAWKRYIKKGIDFLACKRVIKPYVRTDLIYDTVFYTFPNMLIEFSCYYYMKLNKNVKFCMFEDGFSSYSDGLLAVSWAKALFLKLTNRKQFLDENHELFLYAPEYFCQTKKNKKYIVRKMPQLDIEDHRIRKIYNSLFDFSADNLIKEDVVFFEQPYEDDAINEELRKTLDFIFAQWDPEDICVKIHPRGHAEKYGDIKTYAGSTVPAEVIYMNMSGLEDKILISSISTACLSPKLIFDKEPRLILLYRYLHLQEKGIITSGLAEFTEKVLSSYRDRSRIMIPENERELRDCLCSIRGK